MKRTILRALLAGSGVAAIVGCTIVGPEYEEPTADVQSVWKELETPTLTSNPPVDPRWWRDAFADPVLDTLVESAIMQNLSLRSAGLRVLQARQQLAFAVGNRYPQQQSVTADAQWSITNDGNMDAYSLGFGATWEADFWGLFRLAVRSAEAGLEARVADYDGVMLTLVSDVALTYISIRTLELRAEVARRNLDLQRQNLAIARAKLDAGGASALDSEQAQALVHNTEAQVLAFELAYEQNRNSLAILLGQVPQAADELIGADGDIPDVEPEVAVGMPQELIRRRPDIRASERRLAAQSAQIGIAVAELYPHFRIGGSVGTALSDLGGLFDSDNGSINFFGLFDWNVLNYGRLKANIRLQDAFFEELLVDYRNTVLQAQGDVENSIIAYLKAQQQLTAYRAAAAAAERAVAVSTAQYEDGLVNFNTVISTLQSQQQQQDLLASTRGTVAASLVQVYRALGGGWEVRGDRDPAALLPEATKEEMRERNRFWNDALP